MLGKRMPTCETKLPEHTQYLGDDEGRLESEHRTQSDRDAQRANEDEDAGETQAELEARENRAAARAKRVEALVGCRTEASERNADVEEHDDEGQGGDHNVAYASKQE